MTDHELATVPLVEMSDDISALAKALPKAQAAMGEVFKNAANPAFKSKYADLASVVDAVLPALNANGIALLQPAAGLRGDVVQVATMLLHESGQWLRCTMSVTLSKRDAHGIGSAVTYGRRFGLQSMSGVAPTDDDGNAASQHRAPPPADPVTTLANRADGFVSALNAAPTADDLEKAWAKGAKLCAELDLKDPDKLAVITALYETRRDELTANPFTKDA